MLMSSIVWSYGKDLLHHAALNLKIHLVVGEFQGGKKIFYRTFSIKKKKKKVSINGVYGCYCDSSKHDKVTFI